MQQIERQFFTTLDFWVTNPNWLSEEGRDDEEEKE